MREEEVAGRHKEKAGEPENKAGDNTRWRKKEGMKMKRGLMRPSTTTRDFSSHVKPGYINTVFGTAVTK